MITRERIVRTFCDLARIDSPSGEEEEVARHLVQRLEGMGFAVVRDDYGNIIANDGGDDPIILSAHMDTVEPGRGVQPSSKVNASSPTEQPSWAATARPA